MHMCVCAHVCVVCAVSACYVTCVHDFCMCFVCIQRVLCICVVNTCKYICSVHVPVYCVCISIKVGV